MDARRLLISTLCVGAALPNLATADAPAKGVRSAHVVSMAPIPNPPPEAASARPRRTVGQKPPAQAAGRDAIAAANLKARQTSSAADFIGGVQVFTYSPGRIYEIWTAPLRVTTLTLAPGESIISMAAGDTVRWQIGETSSGHGSVQRAHVMIKPMQRGLETNLVLTTSARVYFVQLKSGSAQTLNTAVAWDTAAARPAPIAADKARPVAPDPPEPPAPLLDARFKIEAGRRPPPWTPTMVATDGARTFIGFPSAATAQETPALFVLGDNGESQLVNYRLQGGLWVVDRVLDRAELRLGEKRPQVVRIIRQGARS